MDDAPACEGDDADGAPKLASASVGIHNPEEASETQRCWERASERPLGEVLVCATKYLQ